MSKALEFLQLLYPDGPWVLTAIGRATINTDTFGPGREKELDEWLAQYNGAWNVYYSANRVKEATKSKASKENIRDACYLYVDVDPEPGEDIKLEQRKILARFQAALPRPTFLVFSGGGYQALWRLKKPVRIDGDIQLANEVELYNIALERKYGGDHCHNIDRILRLPGTVNVPTKGKAQKGRRRADAELVWFHDSSYDIGDFPKASRVIDTVSDKKGLTKEFLIPDTIKRVEIDDLDKWNVPDRVKIMVVQGQLDDKKEGDNSRSAWLFDCVCNLIRCGVPDDVIYSIITDSDFRISHHILDQKNASRSAKRQIERGHKKVDEDATKQDESDNGKLLNKINDDYFFLTNQARICSNRNPEDLSFFTVSEFQAIFANQYAEVGSDQQGNPKYVKAGKWWLEHPKRREYFDIEFNPAGASDNNYNLWTGFAVKPEMGDCSLYLRHLLEIVCSGNQSHYEYILKWMARAVQRPELTGGVAIILRGEQGTGKSFFVKQFGKLFGRHYGAFSQPDHLTNKYNAHLEYLCVMFAEEAFFAGDKRHESVLKALVTEETMQVERKYGATRMVPNRLSIIMASNEEWVIPAGKHERRYFVVDCSTSKMQNLEYFHDMADQMEDGGREALLYYLLHEVDITDFNVWNKPKTQALLTQQELSFNPVERWWFECLRENSVDHGWPYRMAKDTLYDSFLSSGGKARAVGRVDFGRKMKTMVDLKVTKMQEERRNEKTGKNEARIVNAFEFPTISDARLQFEQYRREKYTWAAEATYETPAEKKVDPF